MIYTFRFLPEGVDAVEREFGHGRTPAGPRNRSASATARAIAEHLLLALAHAAGERPPCPASCKSLSRLNPARSQPLTVCLKTLILFMAMHIPRALSACSRHHAGEGRSTASGGANTRRTCFALGVGPCCI